MHSPSHPGEILLEMYLKPMNVTITQAADALGVSRKHISAIVNGRASVSPDMAMRLAAAFRPALSAVFASKYGVSPPMVLAAAQAR
jgi:addiction module HigA family antidote